MCGLPLKLAAEWPPRRAASCPAFPPNRPSTSLARPRIPPAHRRAAQNFLNMGGRPSDQSRRSSFVISSVQIRGVAWTIDPYAPTCHCSNAITRPRRHANLYPLAGECVNEKRPMRVLAPPSRHFSHDPNAFMARITPSLICPSLTGGPPSPASARRCAQLFASFCPSHDRNRRRPASASASFQ